MEIKKNGLRTILLIDFMMGIISILLKLCNPELYNLVGWEYLLRLKSLVFSLNFSAIFYVCFVVAFLIISLVSFFIGLHVIYLRIIRKGIYYIKEVMGKEKFEESDYYQEFSNIDILLVAIYILGVIPLILYIILPSFIEFLFFMAFSIVVYIYMVLK